jgi:hypothetical protein
MNVENPMVSGYGFEKYNRKSELTRFFEEINPIVEYVEPIKCYVCGCELLEEEAIESELYEDEYLCGDEICINHYYETREIIQQERMKKLKEMLK